MSVDFTPEQIQIRDAVTRLCAEFGDPYWLERDADGRFPEEFCRAIAEHGYMGIAMPAEYGGSGLGITEAAILMQAISQSGAGNGGVSSVSLGIFGLNPVVGIELHHIPGRGERPGTKHHGVDEREDERDTGPGYARDCRHE